MKNSSENIDGKFSDLPNYSVSEEKDQEILKAINELHLAKSQPSGASSIKYLLTQFFMDLKKFSAVVAAVIVLVIVSYYGSQSSFADHLEGAKLSLADIKEALSDGQITADEDVEALINTLLENAASASEAASEIDDADEAEAASQALHDLYEDALDTFREVADVSEDEDLDKIAENAIESTEADFEEPSEENKTDEEEADEEEADEDTAKVDNEEESEADEAIGEDSEEAESEEEAVEEDGESHEEEAKDMRKDKMPEEAEVSHDTEEEGAL